MKLSMYTSIPFQTILLTFLLLAGFSENAFANNCTAEVPSSVDTSSTAYQYVVTSDPFCCNNQWDAICQNAYDSYSSNGSSSCAATVPSEVDTSGAAYAAVIANDPFCCNFIWDAICQSAYNQLTGDSTGTGGFEGCAPVSANVDISSPAYAFVLSADSTCCTVVWGQTCQTLYNFYQPPASPCNVELPGNVDTTSEAYMFVISTDSYCCYFGWDYICDNAYNSYGSGNGGSNSGSNNCAEVPNSVDTSSTAYATVIAIDPFCCNGIWDMICQNAYNNLTGDTTDLGGNQSCVEVPAGVDTSSAAYTTVINIIPFCCNNSWDAVCQNIYDIINGGGSTGVGGNQPCVEVPSGVDTSSAAYTTVISNDPFCCINNWDAICQNAYNTITGDTTDTGGEIICITPPASVDTLSDAYLYVISTDPFCCNVSWDAICQNTYLHFDENEATNPGTYCVEAPQSVDIVSTEYESVIMNDPFCCDVLWDAICQNAYDALIGNLNNGNANPDQVSISSGKKEIISGTIYPNPATNFINVSLEIYENDQDIELVIVNMLGSRVFFKSFPAQNEFMQIEIEVSSFPSGVYYLRIMAGDEPIQKTFVKN